jgi:UDP-glucose 4-epimerase
VAAKVVVVGATGNLGTSVVQALAEDPEVTSIVGIARRPAGLHVPRTQWVRADMTRDDLVPLFRGADAVIHLAWLFQPTHRPLVTWRVNVQGGCRVFDAAVRAGVPALVHASSVGAYSPGPKDRTVDESWPTDGWPLAAYGREKAYLERVLDGIELARPGTRVVRIRPGFVFKPEAAAEQRRLFLGPFVPGRLIRPGVVRVVPDVAGLRFQVVHSQDVAEAFRLAALRPVTGAFNVAAEPVVDARLIAELLRARVVRLPAGPVRAAISAAWHLRLVPAPPHLWDAFLHLPLMDTGRARTELGWRPRHTAGDAVAAFLDGLATGAGLPTPPLQPGGWRGRVQEVLTGIGSRP